jgi:hypothetical protein
MSTNKTTYQASRLLSETAKIGGLDLDGGSINIPSSDTFEFKEDGTVTMSLNSGTLSVDTIGELTATAGVTVDGVLLKDIGIKCDKIEEKTTDNNVEIANYTRFSANPCFIAYEDGDVAAATGNGTAYVIGDTETGDNANNYNTSTKTFTAPVPGYYHFSGIVHLDGCDNAASVVQLELYDGTTSYILTKMAVDDVIQTTDEIILNGSKTMLMSSSGTMPLRVIVSGEGADDVVVKATNTHFSGFLVTATLA